MSVLKVIELMGKSEKSWEDAAEQIVKEASKSVKNIRSIYIQDLSAQVKENRLVEYRVNGKVTFEVQ